MLPNNGASSSSGASNGGAIGEAILIPTRFVWPHGGRHVHLCGSFTGWRESLPMTPMEVEGHQNLFQVVCGLPPGYHQFKFIVDSEWRHDETQAYMPDPLGNVNNWILVRPMPPAPAPAPLPVPIPSLPLSLSIATSGISHHHDDHEHQIQIPHLQQQQQQQQQLQNLSSSSHPITIHGSQQHHQKYQEQHHHGMDVDFMESGQQQQHEQQEGKKSDHGFQAAQDSYNSSPLTAGASISIHQPLAHTAVLQAQPVSPVALLDSMEGISAADAEASRQRIGEFLNNHYVHELMPESGKVVALDVALPVKQAFHALYEQGLSSAPLWDSDKCMFVGMLSASDFITIIHQLRRSGMELSEEELESHSIAQWKAAKQNFITAMDAAHTPSRRPLLHVGPDDSLRQLAESLLQHGLASAPVLYHGPPAGSPPQLLHVATLCDVLKCISRHFRFVTGSLPLLAQPIGVLPLGTWVSNHVKTGPKKLTSITPQTSLTAALSVLLSEGVSSLPVVDESGGLLDVYARSDITALARERAYTRLKLDDMTVAEALRYRQEATSSHQTPTVARCHMCLHEDSLKSVMDKLALPGVRRVICVEAGSRRVEGIISLTDIFRFLLKP